MVDKTVMDMFADMAKQINLPRIDYETFLDIHRKNLEAMQKSAAVLSEGGRAVLAKQQEILAEVGGEARQTDRRLQARRFSSGSCDQAGGVAKRVFEAAVRNTRTVAELVQKSSSEAPKIVLDRMRESLPKRGRPSSPRRPDTRHPSYRRRHEQLCCNAGEFDGARLGLQGP